MIHVGCVRTVWTCLITVAVLPLEFVSAARGQEPPKKSDYLVAMQVPEHDLIGQLRKEVADDVNGVRLTVNALHDPGRTGNDRIYVTWQFDYSGRRKPLIILKPSLTLETNAQTAVDIQTQSS